METVVGLVIAFLLGTILSAIGALLVVRFQRETRRLGYTVLHSGVVVRHPGEAASNVFVSVSESLLEAGIEDMDAVPADVPSVAVEDVSGFAIMLRNTGTTMLDAVDIRVRLDEDAKVVSAWVEESPDFGDQEIALKRDRERPNTLHVMPPYLNSRAEFVVKILAVENSSYDCHVAAAGQGLELQPIRAAGVGLGAALLTGGMLLYLLGLSAFLTGVSLYGLDGDPGNVAIFQDSTGGKFIIISTIGAPLAAIPLFIACSVAIVRSRLKTTLERAFAL